MKVRRVFLVIFFLVAGFLAQAQNLSEIDPVLPSATTTSTVKQSSLASKSLLLSVAASTFDMVSDSLALVDLYNATNGPLWTSKTNWLAGKVSTWKGVTVTNKRVTSLQLQGNNLVGTIPSSIGNLTGLTVLYLYLNTITGGIPESIGNLTQLKQLFLYDNPLGGTIPSSIGNLVNLTHLYIYRNNVVGDIPASIGNLTSLQILALYRNNLTGNLDWIGTLTNLTQLWLYGNPQLHCTVPASIGNLTKLQQCYLHSNDIYGELPSTIGNLVNLTNFWIHFNYSLTGNVPSSISNWTKMVQLAIGDTDLGGALPSNIGNLTAMKELYIENCRIDGNLPTDLSRATNLAILDLKKLHLTNVPSFITGFTKMASLPLNDNELSSILNFTSHPNKANLAYNVENNKLDFGDLEPHFTSNGVHSYKTFTYSPQADIGVAQTLSWKVGSSDTLALQTPGSFNTYQWQKMDAASTWQNIAGQTASKFIIPNFTIADSGRYRLVVTNQRVTNLTLYSKTFTVKIEIGQVPDNIEFQALKDLYDSLGGNSWTTNTNWPAPGNWPTSATSAQFGTWYGITVTNGDITNIVLSNNNLIGSIPSSIGNLQALKYLGLYINPGITGRIPITLATINVLEQLYLYQCNLTGVVPSAIFNLLQLKFLGLSTNKLTGTIPPNIGNATALYSLSLSGNNLTGSIPPSLSNLSNLVSLSLSNNKLTGAIPSWIGNLSKINTLDLSTNQLTGSIPDELFNLTELTRLSITSNSLTGLISPLLGNLTKMKYLNLTHNQLSGIIPSTLGNLLQLQTLILDNNQLSGSIPSSLGSLTSLTTLALNHNQLTGSIPTTILSLPLVAYISFDNNGITSIPNFADQVNKANLQLSIQNNHLDFSQLEPLIGTGIKSVTHLPQTNIHDLDTVRFVLNGTLNIPSRPMTPTTTVAWEKQDSNGDWSFVYNTEDPTNNTFLHSYAPLDDQGMYRWSMTNTLFPNFTLQSDAIRAVSYVDEGNVPDQIEFNALKNLYDSLDGANWFSKTNWPTTWPTNATNLDFENWHGLYVQGGDVVSLQMWGNNLKGKIPSSIVNLSRLQELNFGSNQLSGSIPAEVGNLTHLQDVILVSNQLTGSIPSSLGNLASLQAMILNDNKLTGSIPSSFGNLNSLTNLYAAYNQLNGAIPSEVGNMANLQWLVLNDNMLTGNIPSSIGNMPGLLYLNLENNQLSGSIPTSLGNLSGSWSQVFLGNNKLTGSIPASLGNLHSASTLDFSHNTLTGNLPSSLGNLTSLSALKLSHNNLTGVVPPEFKNLTSLSWLDLDNNQLSGVFPSLEGVNSLYYLSANNNQFTSIPASLLNLQSWFIKFQNNAISSITNSDNAVITPNDSLSLFLDQNYLDFSQLEPLTSYSIQRSILIPQKNIHDLDTIRFIAHGTLTIPSRLMTPTTTVAWEKQDSSGNWVDITNTSEDATHNLYKRSNATIADQGIYRWKMSSSKVVGTIQSANINAVINASTGGTLTLASTITAISGTGGSIQIVASGGAAPYSYLWSSGETTSTITNKGVGIYSITVTDVLGNSVTKSYSLGYKVRWKDLTGVTDNGGVLTKTAADGWNTGGANSSNLLSPNQDGWLEFTISNTNSIYVLGFAVVNGDFNYQSVSQGIDIHTNGLFYSMESGSSVVLGSWLVGDVIKIARIGSQIKYYRNGIELRSVSVDANAELKVKSTIYTGVSPTVYSSFDTRIFLSGIVTPVSANGTGGGIQVVASEGVSPYSYQWSSGETTSTIQNKSVGKYTVTVTDSESRTITRDYSVGYKVQWKDLLGVTNNGVVLTKTAADGWNTGGANSSNLLSPNQDGWLEFTISNTNSIYVLGFAVVNGDFNYPSVSQGIYIHTSGLFYSMESGASVVLGSWLVGDVIKIARIGSQIKYYRNGIELRSVSVDANAELKVKSTIYTGVSPTVYSSFDTRIFLSGIVTPVSANGTGGGVQVVASEGVSPYSYQWSSGETTSAIQNKPVGKYTVTVTDSESRTITRDYSVGYKVQWKDLLGVTNNGVVLTKTAADGWNTGGANSSNLLPPNQDGWLEFTINNTSSIYVLGFAVVNGDFNYLSVSQGIYIHTSGLFYSMESGASVVLGSWLVGDVIKIARIGSQIKYYRNGIELRSVSVNANAELKVKSTIYTGVSPTVYSSFDTRIFLSSIVTPVSANGTGGGIQVVASEGVSPYSYQWSSGETTSAIQNKPVGKYTVTVTDSESRTITRDYSVGYKVQWKDLLGVTNNGVVLTKTAADGWNTGGANSSNLLSPNQDGWLEFTISNTNSIYVLGFAVVNGDFNYPSVSQGIYIHTSGLFYSMESGASVVLGSWLVGDVIKIARIGSLIKYYRNGIELRSVSVDANAELKVKSTIYTGVSPTVYSSFDTRIFLSGIVTPVSANGTGGGVQVVASEGVSPYSYQWSSGETTSAIQNKPVGKYTVTVTDSESRTITRDYSVGYKVQWKDLLGVTDNGVVLTKTAADGWNTGGANSSNLLPPNQDGWLEFTINNTSSIYVLGFAVVNSDFNYLSVSQGIYIHTSGLFYSMESGASVVLGSWLVGDVIKIARIGSQIKYYRNGIELRSVSVNANAELKVKSTIYTGSSPAIYSSFNSPYEQLALSATVLPVLGNNTGGSLQTTVSGGVTPYVYAWSSGETTSSISNKGVGFYQITVTDAAGQSITKSYSLGYKVQWKEVLGASDNGGVLTKTAPDNWGNGGANSSNVLLPNQDGWIEFEAKNTNSTYSIGFTTNTNDYSYGTLLQGIELDKNGLYYSNVSGTYVLVGSWQEGDIFLLTRTGSQVKYYRNGVEFKTGSIDASVPLYVKSAIYTGISPVVYSSFDVKIFLSGTITPVIANGTRGGIDVVASEGTPPYTYQWSSGENTSSIRAKSVGKYTVTVSDSYLRTITRDYNIGYRVQWKDTLGVTNNAGVLVKKTPDNWGNGGANSSNVLLANHDGWIQFKAKNTNSSYSIGFTINTNDYSYSTLLHGIELDKNGLYYSNVSGAYVLMGSWQEGDIFLLTRTGNQVKYYHNGVEFKTGSIDANVALFVKSAIYTGTSPVVLSSFNEGAIPDTQVPLDTTHTEVIPKPFLLTREGRSIGNPIEHQFTLSALQEGDENDVFQAPPCLEGSYYVAFQLLYDLGDKQTTKDWVSHLELMLMHGDDTVWIKPVRLNMAKQTFISTVFYDGLASCDDDYRFVVARKYVKGPAPQDNIYLKILFFKNISDVFDPATAVSLNCVEGIDHTKVSWSSAAENILEYDLEWVYIEEHENFTGNTAVDAFDFKEPARVTLAGHLYNHMKYYPTGKLWYRIRAVGTNPQYPDLRIPGYWVYFKSTQTDESISVTNHEAGKNWQEQTVFAEEGKFKKVMNYFDGSLRARQAQTNLSTENITLVAESMYDYEGRKSVDVLAVPATDATLNYRPGFNIFKAKDLTVKAHTSDSLKKFHYDNRTLVNSVMSSQSGAGNYYSSANTQAGIHKDYIPDAEGYVYSQTEFLNDGTGRVKRQSGVGRRFAMDGSQDSTHITRNFYGNATKEELIRLFGSNVGVATHYKKNLVVDPNGQVSVSYHDQEDRVIATALAGEKPNNVAALNSYNTLDLTPLTVNISDKNSIDNGVSVTTHKLMNTSANTSYTFSYDLAALGSQIEQLGCETCSYDLKITLTDPEGAPIRLDTLPGSQSEDSLSYVHKDITTASCVDLTHANVQFTFILKDIGDYTLTKSLIPHDLTFEQMQEIVSQDITVQTQIDSIKRAYFVDHTGECEVCTSNCPEADSLTNEAITETAALDCDNILEQIKSHFQELHADEEALYEPTLEELKSHELYCQYEACSQNQLSDVFEKQMARISNWGVAIDSGYTVVSDMLNIHDPFFANSDLSGNDFKGSMQNKLNNILVFVDTINNREFRGTINQIVDPEYKPFYLDDDGLPDPVNGRHILYMDLMGKRSTLSPESYTSQLKSQQWIYFRSYYLEAKRKTKLEIPIYKDCPAAKKELDRTDDLAGIDTPEEIDAWGNANHGADSVSTAELRSSYGSIESTCKPAISKTDSLSIVGHLRSYFNTNYRNFLRLIYKQDLAKNHLAAIQTILQKYGCGLDSVAQDDPMSCAKDTTIIIPLPIELPLPPESTFSAQSGTLMDPLAAESFTMSFSAPSLPEIPAIAADTVDTTPQTADVNSNSSARLLSLSSLAVASVPNSPPPQDEYDALLAFYAATNGSEWRSRAGWEDAANDPDKTTRYVHTWFGVTVDFNTGHVIKITLPDNHLNGTIPNELNNLKELTELDLSTCRYGCYNYSYILNKITNIPSSLNSLTKLKKFDLYSTGSLTTANISLEYITNALSKSTNLEFLDLTSCGIKGPFTRDIGNFKNLMYLTLQNNPLINDTIPQSIGKLTSLTDLNIGSCKLINPIPDSLWTIATLQYLNLSNNNFKDSIPRDIGKLTNLRALYLNSNPFNDSIPYVIGKNLRKLQALYLSSAQLRNPIPESLWTLPELSYLDLSNNLLSDTIPHSIGKLKAIRYLLLSNNPFHDTIPETIGNLKTLYYLSMNSCQLKKPIPDSLWGLSSLSQLSLSYNPFLNDSIPSAIKGLKSLSWLFLSGDSIKGPIPSSIGNLKSLYYLDLNDNQLTYIPPSIGKLKSLAYLNLYNNRITNFPDSLGYATSLNSLQLFNNRITDSIPATIGNLKSLQSFQIYSNKIKGSLPKSIGKLTSLNYFAFNDNKITGAIPESIGKLKSLQYLYGHNNFLDKLPDSLGYATAINYLSLYNNKLRGNIPQSITALRSAYVYLQNNQLTGHIPHRYDTYVPNLYQVSYNKFTFADIIDVKRTFDSLVRGNQISYIPQDTVDTRKKLSVKESQSITLAATIDRNTTPQSIFQWFKSTSGGYAGTPLNTASVTGHTVTLNNIAETDDGNKYYYVITNPKVPGLTLRSRFQTLKVIKPLKFTICLAYDTTNQFTKTWSFKPNWNEVVSNCIANAQKEDSLLIRIAVDKLIEEKVSEFKNTYRTKCLSGLTENFTYSYVPKEYHYTLYYYDQGGSLVQTVPPNGVKPLSSDSVKAFVRNKSGNPRHELITHYQYSSLGQVLRQKTPDAGESNFYYNEKTQLKLSQNAQQAKDNNYSYTRYDEQGRVMEVGEMNTTASLATILSHIEESNFPTAGLPDFPTFSLSDVTKTHYDFGKPAIQALFRQDFLRTRVAFVEVVAKGQTDTLATYYTYDIHGNVKSLIQHIPGLSDKRTDYVYDLISSKVNYVLYQYGKSDQFIHRYDHDSDNRIRDVYTSTDAFIWDKEASYFYYKHGLLARVELGEYRVQGLDYYYSLQGWIKGVNMPYSDPGNDGYNGSVVGRDAFAYTLGYYQDDYKPLNNTISLSDNRDQLWTRYNESMNNNGLFNGNISWMTTDLKKIGQQKGARAKGMQAMTYQYDQLHRIVQSRSLTNYDPTTGFVVRTGTSAYDEDYTYDPNGNIMTLLRHDDKATVQDDFHYDYYKGTNRLREVKPITRDTTITSEVKTNSKVYRNVTLKDGAFVPAGSKAEVKALQNIMADPDFEVQNGSDFWAHIVDGPYQYDEIGNLIFDLDKGVQITWTPNGKVRDVHTKNDSVVVSYKYDGTGNRVEKKVVKKFSSGEDRGEVITRYLHDASGNVMAIYNDTTAIEHPLYGSSRLGMYRGGRKAGERTLGERNYELSNHLGNVLAVITDIVNMTSDSAWASVVSASDYYPFGLAMQGRSFSDTTYRYGFNGMEKDSDINGGGDAYTTLHRIYDARLGRWLSVDPETDEYSDESPYASMENNPISETDPDGDCPWCIAFVKGAVQEYATQVIVNLAEGKDLGDALTDVDGWEIAKAGAIDAVTLGVGSLITKASTAVKLAKAADKALDVEKAAVKANKVAHTTEKVSKVEKNIVKAEKKLAGGCFIKGTLILTAKGFKPIEVITKDDSVWAYSDSLRVAKKQVVYNTFVRKTKQLVTFTMGSERIVTTPEHPLYINFKWVDAKNVNVGDSVLLFNGTKLVINDKEVKDTICFVYNFAVAKFHSYFVSNTSVLVHNNCGQPGPVKKPIKNQEVTTYRDFKDRSVVGDNLEGHELLQHSNLKSKGLATTRLSTEASSKNPVIALEKGLHKQVNRLQSSIPATTQTARQNIEANMKILKQVGVSEKKVNNFAKKAVKHAQNVGQIP